MLYVLSGLKLFLNRREQITKNSTFPRSYELLDIVYSVGLVTKGLLMEPTRVVSKSVGTSLAAQH